MSITVTECPPDPRRFNVRLAGGDFKLTECQAIELRNAIDAALGWPDGIQFEPTPDPKVQAVIDAARNWREAYKGSWHDEMSFRGANVRLDLTNAVWALDLDRT